METDKETTTTPWKTTIIVSTSPQNRDIKCRLSAQQHRIRPSDSIEPGLFIFPMSGTAFLLIDPQDLPERFEESGLIERTKSFFGSNLKILPVQNNADVVKGMLTIAKATSKPHSVTICNRMSLAQAHIIESSPVWKMLRDIL